MNYNDLVKHLKEKKWYVYGAGIVAYNISLALEECSGLVPVNYIVSDKSAKSPFFSSEIIKTLQDITERSDICILVATPSQYHQEILETLKQNKFNDIILVTDESDYEIMSHYHKKLNKFHLIEEYMPDNDELFNGHETDLKVYKAQSSKDRVLQQKYEFPDYVIPIYVGSALENHKPAGIITDNTGSNISQKNRTYSELTASYWVWKNTTHEYKGICHYRRMLPLTQQQIAGVAFNNIDVILSITICVSGYSLEQFGRYLNSKDYHAMLKAVKMVGGEIAECMEDILNSRYIYNYNMFIAKERVFDDYCEWIFSVLDNAEQLCDEKHDRKDRFMGYLGEVLTSLYFMYHSKDLKIVHTKKIWLT